jgi:hypothetical protein
MLAGLGMTALTWGIVYVDSAIPGISPPTPLSHDKNGWVCLKVALLFNVAQEDSKGSTNSLSLLSPKWKKAQCHSGILHEFQIIS